MSGRDASNRDAGNRRGRSGLQGVLDRLGAWNRSPRHPTERHELSTKDLGRLQRVFARLVDAPELSERRQIAAELVTMWAENVPSARTNLLTALSQQALPGAAQRTDLAALGSSTPTSADPQVRLDLLRDAQRATRMPVDPVLDELSAAPGGVRFLIELRAAALALAKGDADEDGDPAAAALDACLLVRLQVVMTPSLIEMRRLDWDTPASLLQRVAALEKVHPIESIEQLRDRLDTDRAAFALFHPGMDNEPLAFVWVAFTRGVPDSLDPITDPAAPTVAIDKADTAVFWSISAPQAGLASLGMGNELIKAAVRELRASQPSLTTFVTLSPIPSLAAHVLATVADGDTLGMGRSVDEVRRLLTDQVWLVSHEADELATPLLQLTARYLTDTGATGRSPDPVANFHLGNGARLMRLGWAANRSSQGLDQSLGIMANYLYEPHAISDRARQYRGQGVVSVGDEVARLFEGSDEQTRRARAAETGRA